MHPRLHLAQVGPVHLPRRPRLLVGVGHPEQQPALLESPVEADGVLEDHRLARDVERVVRLRDGDLVAHGADEEARADELPDVAERGTAGKQDALRGDRPVRRLDPGHRAVGSARQPEERDVLPELDARPLHRERIGAHVPRRVDAPVPGCVRRAAERGGVERGVQRGDGLGVDEVDAEADAALHLDAREGLAFLLLVGREDQVAELAEPAVGAVAIALRPVEIDRPHPEGHGLGRPPLRADDAGRARRRTLAGLAALQDYDAFRAVLLREHGRPSADRARADDDQIRGVSVRHPNLPSRRPKSRRCVQ
jgi:hypothetical protein